MSNDELVKWEVSVYGKRIKRRVAIRETAHFLVFQNTDLDGKPRFGETKEAKESSYSRFFDSFGEARDYLIAEARKSIKAYELRLDRAKSDLLTFEAMCEGSLK